MTEIEWTDAEREAIYTALWSAETHVWCADLTGCPHCQDQERRLYAALAPLVAEREEQAWDDGFDAGHQAARSVNHEWPETPRNPHRIERGES